MRDLIGRTLEHYRLVEKFGAGRMGEVYRARDERLDHDVAIKVFSEEVAGNEERPVPSGVTTILFPPLENPKSITNCPALFED